MRTAEQEIKRLKTAIRKLQRERKMLREFVMDMQWVMPLYNGSHSCAYCGQQKHMHEGCPVSSYVDSIE